tara:strand:- start:92 stop:670 length:579 start_codon:yes stop_codon:yes gene_type:complete
MDSLIKLLTTIGIIAAFGFVGKEYYELLTDLKTQKELIKTQADDVGEVVAIWVEKSASIEDLKNYSAQLVAKKAVIDAEEERKIAEERAKITFRDEIDHDGNPGGTVKITLDASKSTPTEEGDEMTWNWTSTDGKVQIEDNGAKEISFDAEAGQYNFELTVTDSYGASSSEIRIVDIAEEDNEAPIIIIEKK